MKRLVLIIFLAFLLTPKLSHSWWNSSWQYRKNITLSETRGIDRTFEPVQVYLSIGSGKVNNCTKEMRVIDETGIEIPSQVYNETYVGGGCTACTLVFEANLTSNAQKNYTVYYGSPTAGMPSYPSDISVQNITPHREPGEPGSDSYPPHEAYIIQNRWGWYNATELYLQGRLSTGPGFWDEQIKFSSKGDSNYDLGNL